MNSSAAAHGPAACRPSARWMPPRISPSPTPASADSSAGRCRAFQAVQHSLAAMAGEIERARAATVLAIAAAADYGFDSAAGRLRGDGGQGGRWPGRRAGDHHRTPVARCHRGDASSTSCGWPPCGREAGSTTSAAPRTTRGGSDAWRWPPTTRGTSSSAVQHLVDAASTSPRPVMSMPNRSVSASTTCAAVSKRIRSLLALARGWRGCGRAGSTVRRR